MFIDVIQQKSWLANPMRYFDFSNRANYYIDNSASIPNYTSSSNRDVFQISDDIKRLRDSRFTILIGARFNYYIY